MKWKIRLKSGIESLSLQQSILPNKWKQYVYILNFSFKVYNTTLASQVLEKLF